MNISTERPVLGEVADEYLQSLPRASSTSFFADSWGTNEVYFFKRERDLEATTSIAVPFDVDDDIMHASDIVRQIAHGTKAEKPEVVLAVNANWQPGFMHSGESERVTGQYERIVEHLANQRLFGNVLVRTFLTHIPHRNMNLVQRAAIGSIIMQSIGYRPPSYPILRYDADGTFIAPNTIDEHAQAVREKRAYLVKAPTIFRYPTAMSFINENGYQRRVRSDPALDYRELTARIIAGVYGLTKDIIESQLGPTDERPYHEESGSGAQLETWMRVLAIDQREDPAGQAQGGSGENKTFLRIVRSHLPADVEPFYYLDRNTVSHETSSRRIQRLASQLHPAQVPLWEEGVAYQTHIEMARQSTETPPRRHTLEDVMTMVGVMLLRQEQASGHEVKISLQDRSRLAGLIQSGKFYHAKQYPDLLDNAGSSQHRWGQDRKSPLETYGNWLAAGKIMARQFIEAGAGENG